MPKGPGGPNGLQKAPVGVRRGSWWHSGKVRNGPRKLTVGSEASQGIPRSSEWVPEGSKGVSVGSEGLEKVPGGSQWGPEESQGSEGGPGGIPAVMGLTESSRSRKAEHCSPTVSILWGFQATESALQQGEGWGAPRDAVLCPQNPRTSCTHLLVPLDAGKELPMLPGKQCAPTPGGLWGRAGWVQGSGAGGAQQGPPWALTSTCSQRPWRWHTSATGPNGSKAPSTVVPEVALTKNGTAPWGRDRVWERGTSVRVGGQRMGTGLPWQSSLPRPHLTFHPLDLLLQLLRDHLPPEGRSGTGVSSRAGGPSAIPALTWCDPSTPTSRLHAPGRRCRCRCRGRRLLSGWSSGTVGTAGRGLRVLLPLPPPPVTITVPTSSEAKSTRRGSARLPC